MIAVAAFALFISSTHKPASPGAGEWSQKSIAVLPFADFSPGHDQQCLCDGVQEEILTRLSGIRDLKVISRTSTQSFKTAPPTLREIGKQLGAAHILEGTVQTAADNVRVSVRLIKAENDSQLWADKFEARVTDIFAVESEIAMKIAAALATNLTGAEKQALSNRPTQNPEAHEAYLRGLYYWSMFTPGDFDKARDYFQRAIDLDPSYPVAHAGLASYYARAAANGAMPPSDGWPKCEAEVNKALALDDTLAEAYNPRASFHLYYQRDWPAAERDFRRGAALNPNFAELRVHYALSLAIFGRTREALAEIERAVELEPASIRSNLTWARILFAAGKEDAAIAQLRNTTELAPGNPKTHEWLGYFYEKKRMEREAKAESVKALTFGHAADEAAVLEQTYNSSGFDAAMRAVAQRQLEKSNQQRARGEYVPAAEYALNYLRLGDKEQALGWLGKALEERNWFVYELRLDPRFEPLRSDVRFERLLKKVVPGDS